VTKNTDKNIVSGQSIARNEFGISGGIFWSESGNILAFYQKNESNVHNYPLLDINATPGELVSIKYPMAGQKSEEPRVGIYNLKSKKTIYISPRGAKDDYFTNLTFTPDEKNIVVAEVNRDQNHMWLNVYESKSGKFVKTLFEETNDKWIEPEHPAYFHSESNDFVWISESDGFNNLYLYVTKGTNFYDLDEIPSVDILDTAGTIIEGLGGISLPFVTQVKKGVYKVTLGIDGSLCDGKRFFYDRWTNLSIDGVELADIRQKFVPKPFTSQYTIGENQTELQRYKIQYFGIKQGEKIKRGDLRKVVVTIKSLDVPKSVLFDEVYYRLYIKEGTVDVNVHDWTLMDKTNENSFYFDTNNYIPREYHLEIKAKTHTEEIYYKDSIKFEILSEK
jgi:hypothetical protein